MDLFEKLKLFSEKDKEIESTAKILTDQVERSFSYFGQRLKDQHEIFKDSKEGHQYLQINLAYNLLLNLMKKVMSSIENKEQKLEFFKMLARDLADEIEGPLTQEQIQ